MYFIAKFFSNAIREDKILNICNGGIIFARGSAGTRQEIFQYCTRNAYSDEVNVHSSPMIFYTDFWVKNNLFPTLKAIAAEEDLAKNVNCFILF